MNWLTRMFHRPRFIAYTPAHATVLTICPLPRLPVAQYVVTGAYGVRLTVRFDWLSVN